MLSIRSVKYRIQVYLHVNGKAPFEEWATTLDKQVRSRITARIARFEDGHFGDHKPVGEGVFEARFFFGSGYRVYYAIHQNQVILLLSGGDKATQTKDVDKAIEFFRLFLEVQNANKKS